MTTQAGSSPLSPGSAGVLRETHTLKPVLSLFQTQPTSRKALSPLVCSVSPSSSKCPGVSIPTLWAWDPDRGGAHTEGEAMESRRDSGWRLCEGKHLREREGRDSGKRKEPTNPSSFPRPLQLPIHKPRFLGRAVARSFPEPRVRAACSSPGNRIHMLGGGAEEPSSQHLFPGGRPAPVCFLLPCVPYELTEDSPHSLRHPHLNSIPGSFA